MNHELAASAPPSADHAHHFQDVTQQAHAARLGMWVFLASEVLLFSALFGVYAAMRAHYPDAFASGVEHNDLLLGTTNTVVLLTSSLFVALADGWLRHGEVRRAVGLLWATVALGAVFLAVKSVEYSHHFHEGIFAGAAGAFFRTPEGSAPGYPSFFNTYYLMTGTHALHVVIGMAVIAWAAWSVGRGRITPARHYPLELCGLYWHLVDIIWLFLWPMFYLAGAQHGGPG